MWKSSKKRTLAQWLTLQGQSITLLMGLPESGSTLLQIYSPYANKVLDTPLYGMYTHENAALIHCWSAFLQPLTFKQHHHHWEALLKALHKKKVHCMITVSVIQLLNRKQPGLQKQIQLLLQRFHDVQKITGGAVNSTLVLTQLDHLVGFLDYFSSYHNQGKQGAFGVSLNKPWDHPALLETFDQKFHECMEEVNGALLKNIEQCSTRAQRGVVKDFPIQLESLRKPIASFLQDLISTMSGDGGTVSGLYFTSCQQDPLSLDRLNKVFQNRFSINHPLYEENTLSHGVYFVSGLWEKIQRDNAASIVPPKKLVRALTLGTLSTLFLGYAAYLYHGYYTHEQWLTNGKKTLAKMDYLLASEQDPHALLTALQWLQHLAKAKIITSPLQPHGTAMVSHHLQQTYINNLHTTCHRVLEDQLQEQLKHPSPKEAAIIYQTLKGYLMLSHPEHYDPHYLAQTVHPLFQQQSRIGKASDPHYFFNVEEDLRAFPPKMLIDPRLVTRAQHYLLQLPRETLALAKLASHSASLKTITGPVTLHQHTIPLHYQKAYLPTFYYEIIPLIAKEILEGDWVLAQPKVTAYALNDQWQALSDPIRAAYLKAYVAFWQNHIATYESVQFQSLEDAHEKLQTLLGGAQSLLHEWRVIKNNIMLDDHATSTVISKDFIHLVRFLEDESHLANIQQRLKALDETLLALIQAEDVDRSAYLLAKKRYTHALENDPWNALNAFSSPPPEPLSAWLEAIAQQSWHGVMVHGDEYVRRQWELKVHAPFSHIIADKYPYAPQGTSESTPEELSLFFGPGGVLAQFYREFLAPFVTANKKGEWIWQTINGCQLEEDPFLLQQLQRSASLLTLLYPSDKQDIQLNEQLSPVALEPGIKSMTLTVNKHHGKIYPESQHSFPIQWAPTDYDPLVILSLTNHEGEHFQIKTTGPWAWFHLLDKAEWAPAKTEGHWRLTFDIGGLRSEWDYSSSNNNGPVALLLLREFE